MPQRKKRKIKKIGTETSKKDPTADIFQNIVGGDIINMPERMIERSEQPTKLPKKIIGSPKESYRPQKHKRKK